MTARNRSTSRGMRVLVILLIVAVILGGASIAAVAVYRYRREQNTLKLLTKAREAVERQAVDEARTAYRQYLYRKPNDADALTAYAGLLTGQLAESPRLVVEALSALRRLHELQPDDGKITKQLTDLLISLREFAETETLATEWRRRDSSSADAILAHAIALRGLKRYAEAADMLGAAVESNPDIEGAYPLLIALHTVELNDPKIAREWLDRGLERAARSPAVHLAAFGYFQGLGDVAAAEQHLAEALTLAPSDPQTLYPAIVYNLSQNRLTEARSLLERARTDAPGDRGMLLLQGELASRAGDPEELRRTAAELLAAVKDDIDMDLVARAGELYLTAGDLDQADACITRLNELKDPSIRLADRRDALRARRALVGEKPFVALAELERLRHRREGDVATLELLALAYANAGAVESARLAYRDWVARAPENVRARLSLARFELQQGQAAAARMAVAGLSSDRADESQQLNGVRLAADLLDWIAESRPAARRAALLEPLAQYASRPPDGAQSARLLARCLALADFPAELVEAVRAREADPGTGSIIAAARGRALLAKDDSEEALALAERLIADPATAADGWELKLLALLRAGDSTQAEEFVRNVPASPEARGSLAAILADHERNVGRTEAAHTWYAEAAKLLTADVTVRRRLAELSSDWAGAEPWIEQIRGIEGDDGLTWRFERASALLRFRTETTDAAEAAKLLTDCVTERPEWLEARTGLALAQEKTGKLDEAIASLQDVIVRQPQLGEGPLALRLVGLLKQRNRYEEADRYLTRLVTAAPNHPDVLRQRTEQLIRQRDIRGAAEHAQRALDAGVKTPEWHVLTADLLIAAGDAPRAEEVVRGGLKDNSASSALQWTLVRALSAQGRTADAEDFLRRASTEEEGADATLLLARFLELQNRPDEAESAIDTALKRSPETPAVLAAAAEFWANRGDRTRRLDFARRAVLASGQDPRSSLAWAESLAVGGNPQEVAEAEDIVRRRLSAAPDDVRALVLAGRLAVSADPPRLQEAAQNLLRAVQLDPSLPQAHALLAAVHMRLGRLDDAEKTMESALIRHPEDADLLLLQAELDGYRGRPERSVATLRRLLELRPRHEQATHRLADACLQLGWSEQCITWLTPSSGALPTVAQALSLGRLHDARGNRAGARAYFDQALQYSRDSAEAFQYLLHHLAKYEDYATIQTLAQARRTTLPQDLSSWAVAGQMLGSHPSDAVFAEAGLRMLFELAAEHPDQAADAMYRAGLCYYQRSDFAAAASRFIEAHELKKGSPEPVNALAWLYTRHMDRAAEAVKLIQDYLADGGRETADLLDTFGTALLRTGDLKGAEERLTRALEIAGQSPTLAAANFHLGQLHQKAGRETKARQFFAKAAELDARISGLDDEDRRILREILGADKPLTPPPAESK